ncbi:MAG: hypothetical protein WD187_02225 [Candidatus Woykebacteria bacterium]
MMRLFKKHPIHILFFSVFPVLFFFSNNIRETTLSKTMLPLSVTFISVGILFFIFRRITKSVQKAGIIVSIFVFLFFSFGHFTNFLVDMFNNFALNFEVLVISVWLLLFTAATYIIVRSKVNFSRLTQTLNVISLALVSISLINIAYYEIRSGRLFASQKPSEVEELAKTTKPLEPLRDIYYIVPDRYANQNALKEYYQYDNSEFIKFLESKDFYVAADSFTNYSKTFTSLASSLNMEYLDFLTQAYPDTDDWSVVYPLIEENKVQRFLQNLGYKFIYFGDWWEPTRVNRFADQNINYHGTGILDEFTSKLLETTLAYPLIRNNEEWLEKVRNGHEFKFEQLEKVAEEPGPKFVFVHMLLPHDPYVFDEDCNKVEEEIEVGSREAEKAYVKQLKCTNSKFETLLGDILANSNPEPIIILQSDEGPFPAEFGGVRGGIDWTDLSREALRSHMLILNAYHLPEFENKEKLLQPSISPVNSFRIVFNHYFNTNLEILPDKSFIFAHIERPYDFIDVTGKLK